MYHPVDQVIEADDGMARPRIAQQYLPMSSTPVVGQGYIAFPWSPRLDNLLPKGASLARGSRAL